MNLYIDIMDLAREDLMDSLTIPKITKIELFV